MFIECNSERAERISTDIHLVTSVGLSTNEITLIYFRERRELIGLPMAQLLNVLSGNV